MMETGTKFLSDLFAVLIVDLGHAAYNHGLHWALIGVLGGWVCRGCVNRWKKNEK